ncbi:histidine kinase [uncultured Propionibacterium sp.]|uniref:sensor histidine kinase n=1 Tax=uncultured Propionibacterium sp. TaxID=218066 RepID=UPI00292F612E|nr:histidine kinase [uncultured Propionibacterium sp.]
MVIGIAAMAARANHPLLALSVETGVCLLVLAAGLRSEPSVAIPYLAVLHTCIARCDTRRATVSAISPLALAAAAAAGPDRNDGLLWAGRAGVVLCVAAAGLMTRVRQSQRESLRRAEQERLRADRMAEQRDRALERERLAFRLHDSVGHCLTTIIALSEGLSGFSMQSDYVRAVRGINSLAREGLGEARRVMESLSTGQTPGPGDSGDAVVDPGPAAGAPQEWDAIGEVIDRVRASGIVADFTEEGVRPSGGGCRELCFFLTREALTNCLRHGAGITHITVLWQHRGDGSTRVLVEDDGIAQRHEGPGDGGTGLRRYRRLILGRRGDFYAGSPNGNGWVVDATIAPLRGEEAAAS